MTASGDTYRHARLGAGWRTPWSAQAWQDPAQVLTALPVALVSGTATAVMLALALGLSWTVWPAAVIILRLFACSHRLTRWHRARLSAFGAFDVAEVAAPALTGTVAHRFWSAVRLPSTWTQVAYHLAAPLLAVAGGTAVAMTWAAALVMTTAPLWSPRDAGTLAAVCLGGLVALFAAPWVARWTAVTDVAVARLLLRPSRSELLARLVDRLTVSRADVVAAADAERRRIERDLHDGAQQRLVSLALNLGIARATLTDVPEPAREAIAQAHDEAKRAVKELRDFVRGLNPAILQEQGLDAALSGLAARSAVPVRLYVDVTQRVAPVVESVAFFVVSEALTNIAKHAQASSADLHVARKNDRLHLMISDDGRGGAGVSGGTGLRGLVQRVGSVDGVLHIDSPLGGPTTCGSQWTAPRSYRCTKPRARSRILFGSPRTPRSIWPPTLVISRSKTFVATCGWTVARAT